jgi:hypothetical protein
LAEKLYTFWCRFLLFLFSKVVPRLSVCGRKKGFSLTFRPEMGFLTPRTKQHNERTKDAVATTREKKKTAMTTPKPQAQ